MGTTSYLIGLGSNRPGRHGPPRAEVAAAMAALRPVAASRIHDTPPLGPSIRRFANAVVRIESAESPPELLARLKRVERAFGRRRGRRWDARVLDLDLLLWSQGAWSDRRLTIPHPLFRERAFVLEPLVEIAPGWRDPITGLSVRALRARLRASRPVDRARARP